MKTFLGFLLFFTSMYTSTQNIKQKAIPLEGSASLDQLISAAANKELVLLGDAVTVLTNTTFGEIK